MTETQTNWYIIVNPHAGSGKTMDLWMHAEQRLASLKIRYTVSYTGYKQHAKELASRAAEAGYRKMLAVGGDGSLHEMLCGIMSWCSENNVSASEFCIGVAPIGSGNDWLRSLGAPHDIDNVIDKMVEGITRRVDVGVVSFGDGKTSYMANVGGVGFDSHVCRMVNIQKEGGKRSKLIYASALMRTIKTLRKTKVQLIADDEELFNGDCYSIALGNGPYSGGGMRQVPSAIMDDNTLNGMIVPIIPVMKILPQVPHLFDGKLEQSAGHLVRFFKFKSLQILPLDAGNDNIVEVDGEIEGRLPISITLADAQINVLA